MEVVDQEEKKTLKSAVTGLVMDNELLRETDPAPGVRLRTNAARRFKRVENATAMRPFVRVRILLSVARPSQRHIIASRSTSSPILACSRLIPFSWFRSARFLPRWNVSFTPPSVPM